MFCSLSSTVLPFALHVLTFCAAAACRAQRTLAHGGGKESAHVQTAGGGAEEGPALLRALGDSVAATQWSALAIRSREMGDDSHSLTCLLEAVDAVSSVAALQVRAKSGGPKVAVRPCGRPRPMFSKFWVDFGGSKRQHCWRKRKRGESKSEAARAGEGTRALRRQQGATC